MPNLLDEAAQTALAILYTYHHVDVRVEAPTKATVQATADQLRANHQGAGKPNAPKALAMAQASAVATIKHEITTLKRDRGDAVVAHVSDNLLLYKGSEIDLDTVAITAQGTTLYMACNFKVRRNRPSDQLGSIGNFDYFRFNKVDPAVFGAIAGDIWKMLDEQPREPMGESRARHMTSIEFISTIEDATDAYQSAAPHAEMQIISYLYRQNLSFMDLYMGVSKQCCKKCAIILDALTVKYNAQHDNTVKNWFHPKALSTTSVMAAPRWT
jgi:hypothetical protein